MFIMAWLSFARMAVLVTSPASAFLPRVAWNDLWQWKSQLPGRSPSHEIVAVSSVPISWVTISGWSAGAMGVSCAPSPRDSTRK